MTLPAEWTARLDEAGPSDDDGDWYRRACARGGCSFRPATEDWHPCFPGGLVGIVVTQPLPERIAEGMRRPVGSCRIVVRGMDDTAMAIECGSIDEARAIVLSLPSIIERAELVARGFARE